MLQKGANLALARKYGMKTKTFRQLSSEEQMAIYWYCAINGERFVDEMPDAIVNIIRQLRNAPPSIKHPKRAALYVRLKKAVRQSLPEIIRIVEDSERKILKWGTVKIPTRDAIKTVWERSEKGPDPLSNTFENFEAYHKWYSSIIDFKTVNHSRHKRWPCILSSFNDEFLEDGWHRFHCYVRQKAKTIPCIAFLN